MVPILMVAVRVAMAVPATPVAFGLLALFESLRRSPFCSRVRVPLLGRLHIHEHSRPRTPQHGRPRIPLVVWFHVLQTQHRHLQLFRGRGLELEVCPVSFLYPALRSSMNVLKSIVMPSSDPLRMWPVKRVMCRAGETMDPRSLLNGNGAGTHADRGSRSACWEGETRIETSWPPKTHLVTRVTWPRAGSGFPEQSRDERAFKFAELKISNCRWPVAEADGEILFCGDP